jgi:uncharacterized membrane protein
MESNSTPSQAASTRLEALTDATFAIIMTLLVLELRVPETDSHTELLHGLRELFPSILSFVISFIVLGVYWTAHHTQFRYITRVDHKLVWFNITYLLLLSFVPFSAALLGKHHTEGIAIQVYAVNLLLATLVHFFMWRHAAKDNRLTYSWVDPRLIRFGSQVSYYSLFGYLAAAIAAIWSVQVGLLLLVLIPIPFVLGLFYKILFTD